VGRELAEPNPPRCPAARPACERSRPHRDGPLRPRVRFHAGVPDALEPECELPHPEMDHQLRTGCTRADGRGRPGGCVESASVHVEAGSHPMRFLYVPSTSGEGTTVFVTNLRVGPDEAESFVDATVIGGKSRTSTRASEVISSRRRPRKTTACGCSTSCSQCCCTTSGGSRTTC